MPQDFRCVRWVAAAFAAALSIAVYADQPQERKDHKNHKRPLTVKIIGFNDYHGNLETRWAPSASTPRSRPRSARW